MIDPETIKIGDRLVWHKRWGGPYCVKDGHGATVIGLPYKSGKTIIVYVKWDDGTGQNDGGYELKNFDRMENKSVVVQQFPTCTCEHPNLVENCVAGNKFLYCRVCKKEKEP